MPALTIVEHEGCVRLTLGGFARGEGWTLQEAADDLVACVLRFVLAFRANGFRGCTELRPDLETISFLQELGEIAASGGDIRERVFD